MVRYVVRRVFMDRLTQILGSCELHEHWQAPDGTSIYSYGVYKRQEDGTLEHMCDTGDLEAAITIKEALNFCLYGEG